MELPKPDKRFKPGYIKQDKSGRFRGHPDTVTPRRLEVPSTAPVEMQLNPPIVVSSELGRLIEEAEG